MTLALLITAASGAWATVYSSGEVNSAVLKVGDILYDVTIGNYFKLAADRYKYQDAVQSENSAPLVNIVIDDDGLLYQKYRPVTADGQDGNAWVVVEKMSVSPNSGEVQVLLGGIFYDPNSVYPTTDAETEGATFTEATFNMPAFDATAEYELVRDLSVETALNIFVIENEEPVALTEDSRLRIAKNGDNGYLPVNTLTCAFIDGIENVTMTPQQIIAAGMTPVFYLLGENDTWTPVPAANINPQTMLPTNIAPGQTYRMTLVANEGSIYDGETPQSVTITLFEGYPVEVAAGEYATFYKDENLYVEDEDAKLYTISSVEGDKAYLSSAFDAAPAYTPLLVFNSSEKPKTILLIPTEQEPNLALTVAREFTGTLEGTTLQALLGCDSYAFNGKAFVWVKDEIAVPANKCWLAITTGTPNNAKTITIVFDEDATGVRSVDNGQLTMDNDVWYDLNGRKLNRKPTTKGVYIKNGKKVVIK